MSKKSDILLCQMSKKVLGRCRRNCCDSEMSQTLKCTDSELQYSNELQTQMCLQSADYSSRHMPTVWDVRSWITQRFARLRPAAA